MKNSALSPDNFFKTACFFEGSLIVVAIFLGWLAGVDPFASLNFNEAGIAAGFLATLPLLIILLVMQQLTYAPLEKIKILLLETLGPHLQSRHWTDLLILASIAGFSEEVLFRGFLQPWIENAFNALTGLIVSNLIFALVHAVTPLYAVLALLIGLYLGNCLDYGAERNLLIPITIHSLYDFAAFLVIARNFRSHFAK